MVELALAMLAGAAVMGAAVESFRIWENDRRARDERRSRARIRRELDMWRDRRIGDDES